MTFRIQGVLFLTVAATLLVYAAKPSHTLRTITSNKKGTWEASAQYLHFAGKSDVIALANRSLEQDARKALAGFLKDAADQLKDLPHPDREYAFEEKAKLVIADSNLI